MTINFQCTHCSQEYVVDPNHAGKLIQCRSCNVQVRIPVAASSIQNQAPQQSMPQPSAAVNASAVTSGAGGADNENGLNSLPAELNEMLVKKLEYARSAPIGEIQADMERLRSFDKYHEENQSKYSFRMIIFIVVLLVFGIGGVLLMTAELMVVGILCSVVAVVGLVFTIINATHYNRHARLNLDDKRYECMNEFLRLIAVDTGDDATFDTKIHFGKHDHQGAFVGEGKVSYWDVKFFANDWFSVSGRFKDGTKFTLSIKEKQQNRSRWKRSMSGKMKHKSKVKNSEEISLVIRPKEKRYPELQKLVSDAPQALQIPEYAELKSFTFQQSAIVLKLAIRGGCRWRDQTNVNQQVKERVNLLAMMMLSVYQMLNLSRELQKNAG